MSVMGLPDYQEIFLFSLGLSLLMTLASKFLANQQKMKQVRRDMDFHRKKASEAQKAGDAKKANEHMSDMLKASQSQFRHNMKPMMFSFLIVILAASWFGAAYAESKILSPVSIPFVGAELNWFWWYLLIVLPFSTFFRKVLDVA
jgi:uncharacterized membrane protein (DUF106 family)